MKFNKNTLKYLFYSLLLIILTPGASAYTARSGISPLNSAIELISRLFNIEVLQNNEVVQQGFLKFMIFIVLFAVSNYSLKKTKIFDAKTAGIVSFAFSMIGVFMMPTDWLLATGGLVTLVMSSIIFLGFFWGLAIVAVFVLRKKGDDDKMGWIKNLLGIILLLILLTLVDDWAVITHTPIILLAREEWIKKIFMRKER